MRAKNVLNMLMQSFIAVVRGDGNLGGCRVTASPSPKGRAVYRRVIDYLGTEAGWGRNPNATYGAQPCRTKCLHDVPDDVRHHYSCPHFRVPIAERMKFSARIVIFITFMEPSRIYAPLAHMVWGDGGFLRNLGALDFAGGTVVHISSGVSALVLVPFCWASGDSIKDADTRPHNLPMTLIGTGLAVVRLVRV